MLKGHSKDGFKTLVDAVGAMNITCRRQDQQGFSSDGSTEVEMMLEAASRRFTLASTASPVSNHVKAFTEGECVAMARSPTSGSDARMSFIYLEPRGPDCFKNEVDLQSSVLLYNLGLVYFCGASGNMKRDHMMARAIRMLRLSYEALENSLKNNEELSFLERSLSIGQAILQNLIHLSAMVGLHDDCQSYCLCLQQLEKQSHAVAYLGYNLKGSAAGAA